MELGRRLMKMLRSTTGLAIAIHDDHSTPDVEESMTVPASHMAASCRCSILIAHAIHQGLLTPIPAFSRDMIGTSQCAWRWPDGSGCATS